jgi:branched-chain amino acid aminotransferase
MWVFLNGEFVAEEKAVVSVFDRSFRYGDGLFEGVLALNGKFFRWDAHWARLQNSARLFKLSIPHTSDEMALAARDLLRRNSLTDAVVRLQISRGTGPRGYAPTGDETPVTVISVHPAPSREPLAWKLTVAPVRVSSSEQLQGHKTGNRLLQILAAMHARECGADEAVLVNTDGHVCEGSTSNVFWIQQGVVCTPPLLPNVLPGVTRAAIFDVCKELRLPSQEQLIRPEELRRTDGVFLTLTSRGVVSASSLDGEALPQSRVTARAREGFEALLKRECA